MVCRICITLLGLTIAVVTAGGAVGQLLPEVTPKPVKPPAAKPAQILVQTSPNAEVYLDDQYTGRASSEGRLVIANPKPGERNLRVSLTGKKDFRQKITVVAGKELTIVATLTDLPGSILVTTTPGAEVSLDDSSRGAADAKGQLTISDVATGAHALRITAHGKKDFSQTVNVSSGQATRVEGTLTDLPGSILVTTTPGAEVSVDDSSRGAANAKGQLTISDVATGDHTLRITARGKKDFSQTVKVSSGQETHVEAVLLDLTPTAGTVRRNSKDKLKYVWIPPGSFVMGCSPGDDECLDDEKPAHRVTISKAFWMGQTEVTVGAYKRFAQASGRSMPPEPHLRGGPLNPGWGNEAMPIVNVTWDEAQAYCSWAGGRLPTEAEWEYAARGGSTASRYGDLDAVAWYADNGGRERLDSVTIWNREPSNYDQRLKENGNAMHEVGQKRANGFGLSDVLGNVWEWVNDWYDDKYYQNGPSQNPPGPTSGRYRVLRGGSWFNLPRFVRVSIRAGFSPDVRNLSYGFRCRREAE